MATIRLPNFERKIGAARQIGRILHKGDVDELNALRKAIPQDDPHWEAALQIVLGALTQIEHEEEFALLVTEARARDWKTLLLERLSQETLTRDAATKAAGEEQFGLMAATHVIEGVGETKVRLTLRGRRVLEALQQSA